MRFFSRYQFLFLIIILSIVFSPVVPGFCEGVREPVWADRFYPGDTEKLIKTIKKLTDQAQKTIIKPPGKDYRLKALIMPHAGYIYSGLTAAHSSHVLKGKSFETVYLLGLDHNIGFSRCAVSQHNGWKTPLGIVTLSPEAKLLMRSNPDLFRSVPESDRVEHSLEVIVPFLQYYLNEFHLIPLTLGRCDPKQLAKSLSESADPANNDNTLLVASSDLSHYLSYDRAVKKDRATIEKILDLNSEGLCKEGNCACGIIPVLTLIELAKKYKWKPYLIHYSNSGDTAGDKERVVGYAAIAFYGGASMKSENSKQFSIEQGKVLVELARKTICEKLQRKKEQVSIPDDDIFYSKRGTFVTLKIKNQLRGCIGNLSSDESVVDGIRRNALNAAFSDFRFSPLRDKELDLVDIEISILTEPMPLPHSGGQDLLSKLRPGIDGVIIKSGRNQATFLPQVWEQLPEPQEFIEHLCRKANLPSDAWRYPELEVETYQVQHFDEEK